MKVTIMKKLLFLSLLFSVAINAMERGSKLAKETPDVIERAQKTNLIKACQDGDIEIVRYFILNGADVNQVNRSGDTPLHIASRKGHAKICKLLLEYNANLFLKNGMRETPFYVAKDKELKENMFDMFVAQHSSIKQKERIYTFLLSLKKSNAPISSLPLDIKKRICMHYVPQAEQNINRIEFLIKEDLAKFDPELEIILQIYLALQSRKNHTKKQESNDSWCTLL